LRSWKFLQIFPSMILTCHEYLSLILLPQKHLLGFLKLKFDFCSILLFSSTLFSTILVFIMIFHYINTHVEDEVFNVYLPHCYTINWKNSDDLHVIFDLSPPILLCRHSYLQFRDEVQEKQEAFQLQMELMLELILFDSISHTFSCWFDNLDTHLATLFNLRNRGITMVRKGCDQVFAFIVLLQMRLSLCVTQR
jgi:hypothetical protein